MQGYRSGGDLCRINNMKILFIKSTSLQHLSLTFEKVMESLNSKFKIQNSKFEIEVDVLAHPHAIESLKGFGFINRIIAYNHTGNFNPFYVSVKDIRKEGYDVIVVPFNNISGSGYENVIALSVCLGAKQIVTCNRFGEMKVFNIKKALLSVVKGYSYYPVALVMTPILFVIGIIVILIKVASFKLKELFHCSIAPLLYRSNNETIKQ